MLPPETVLDFFKKKDKFIIATHMNPDGDGLGSAIALSLALKKIGKKSILTCKDRIPQQYKFLPGQEEFYLLKNGIEKELTQNGFKNLVLIDCNDIDRLLDKKQDSDLFSFLSCLFSVVIDHHETEKNFGNIRWVIPDSAATGLMIFHLIKNLPVNITDEMATNLYSAISVDTGNFRYENTSAEVLSVASELLRLGAKPHIIYRELFESWSRNRFDLFLKIINTLEIIDSVAIIYVTKEMFDDTGTTPDDTEHFVDFPRIMKDIKISVLFRELDKEHYKVSLRSKDEINVAKVASSFGGGGHKNAAGFKINKDLITAKKLLLDKVLIELSPNTL